MSNSTKQNPHQPPIKKNIKINIVDFIVAFLFPTLIGKAFIIYFGAQYSDYPGEGYGYYLIGAIVFTLAMALRLIWKYRHY